MQIAFVDGKAVPCRITSKQVYSLFPQGLAGLHRVKTNSLHNNGINTNYATTAQAELGRGQYINAAPADIE